MSRFSLSSSKRLNFGFWQIYTFLGGHRFRKNMFVQGVRVCVLFVPKKLCINMNQILSFCLWSDSFSIIWRYSAWSGYCDSDFHVIFIIEKRMKLCIDLNQISYIVFSYDQQVPVKFIAIRQKGICNGDFFKIVSSERVRSSVYKWNIRAYVFHYGR